MDKSSITKPKHGLTLVQWSLLLVAFVIGLGSSFAIREVFPPAHANVIHANVIHTAPANPVPSDHRTSGQSVLR